MELDATAQDDELTLNLPALMDAVVVPDDVDGLGVEVPIDFVSENDRFFVGGRALQLPQGPQDLE